MPSPLSLPQRLRPYLPQDKALLILILGGLTGVGGALAVLLFRLALVGLHDFFAPGSSGMVGMAKALPWWGRLLLPTIGGLLAGLLLDYGPKLTSSKGSTSYLEAITLGDGKLGVRNSLMRSLASLCSVASGASIGREGPMVQLAALVGSSIGRYLKLSKGKLQLLVACGATAGLASAYNAPIAGLLFVAEIAHGSLSKKTLAPLIVASVLASVVSHRFFGIKPVYVMPTLPAITGGDVFLFLGLGVACGFAAPVFRWLLDATRKGFSKISPRRLITLPLGGLCVGLISISHPNVWGNGYSVVNDILHTPWTATALLAILGFKVLATTLSYGSGAVGGVFTPTLFVGAALGSLYGLMLGFLSLTTANATVSYTVVGMGAFLSAVTYAPLMSILMLFEMTLNYEIVLPLMLTCVISHHIAHRFRPDSIYRK
jgi:CIC family chloride channel protein